MDINLDNAQTSLNISESVVCTIANEAVKELEGVYSLSNLPTKVVSKFNPLATTTPKQVNITFLGDSAHIDVGIIVNMNFKIRDTAEHVQAAIKNAVQDMTGITVSKVNVFVTGVNIKEQV